MHIFSLLTFVKHQFAFQRDDMVILSAGNWFSLRILRINIYQELHFWPSFVFTKHDDQILWLFNLIEKLRF